MAFKWVSILYVDTFLCFLISSSPALDQNDDDNKVDDGDEGWKVWWSFGVGWLVG